MASSPAELRGLYRALLRGGRLYPDYNFREFVLRRTRQGFRAGRGLAGDNAAAAVAKVSRCSCRCADRPSPFIHQRPHAASVLVLQARESLAVLQRQSMIAGFYRQGPSVMEELERRRK
jgi:hypothetical protein